MYTLTVKLKQHTPLIHFQHDQDGATLRASEVKPKLDKYIIRHTFHDNFDECKELLVGYDSQKTDKMREKFNNGYRALDYKLRIDDNVDNILFFYTNVEREYTKKDREKDINNDKIIKKVHLGDIIEKRENNKIRYIIEDDEMCFFAKKRKSDSKIIYDLNSYPCFFANIDSDITNYNEYRKVTFAKNPFCVSFLTKHQLLYDSINSPELLSTFFMNHNFGTRQSKGFGSFYIDENDTHYVLPSTNYSFSLSVKEEYNEDADDIYYDNVFFKLFSSIELFYKALRSGINIKKGKKTVFYFKSLAFLYCKNKLMAEWDKKRVKTEFYFYDIKRRKDSFQKQRNEYPIDSNHDILFFDANTRYDIRDLMGFSTNEQWQSYNDSIEKKVAISENNRIRFPRNDDSLPVERMRSPLLIKPICSIDNKGNTSYRVHLLFQDEEVGISGLKQQQKMCFFSSKELNDQNRPKQFMLDLPQGFSMSSFFDYIFNELQFNIYDHVENQYHDRNEYKILSNIFSQLINNTI